MGRRSEGEKFEIGGVWVVEKFRQNYIREL
jgi:hypothetical protein